MTYLLPSNYVNKQLTLGLRTVEHGITKRKATYLLLFLQNSVTWSLLNPPAPMILLLSCCTILVYILFVWSLLLLSTILPCISVEYRRSADQITNESTLQHEARAHTLFKLQTKTLVYSHGYSTFSSGKQYTVMWQVLWLSPSSERTRPYLETSEMPVFLELVPSQRRK